MQNAKLSITSSVAVWMYNCTHKHLLCGDFIHTNKCGIATTVSDTYTTPERPNEGRDILQLNHHDVMLNNLFSSG